jgi:hypothetical protein
VVAVNEAVMLVAGIVAVTPCGVAIDGPVVSVVDALPSVPVWALAGVVVPPSAAVKFTVVPATGLPSASSTSTTNGVGRGWPAMPVWPSPETFVIWVGVWTTDTAALALADPALAEISAVPDPCAVTRPVELTVATAPLLLLQLIWALSSGSPF